MKTVPIVKKVWNVLAAKHIDDWVTAKQVATKTGVTPLRVAGAMYALIQEGSVRKRKTGVGKKNEYQRTRKTRPTRGYSQYTSSGKGRKAKPATYPIDAASDLSKELLALAVRVEQLQDENTELTKRLERAARMLGSGS